MRMIDGNTAAELRHDLAQDWDDEDHQDPDEWQDAQEWALSSNENY